MNILTVKNLVKKFPGLLAIDDVSFDLEEGTVLGLIGPNGSGKSTILNMITGYLKIDGGTAHFKSHLLNGKSPTDTARLGIGRTFQMTRVFKRMSVMENLLVATPDIEKCRAMIEFLELQGFEDKPAVELDAPQQKVLEYARILLSEPELILLDEPFAGVHPAATAKMLDNIEKIKEQRKTFILISHDITTILKSCDRVLVLREGKLIYDGIPQEVAQNRTVVESYLGA